MSNKVIVYSKPDCPNCEHVKWGLDAQEVPYEVRMIELKVQTDDLNTQLEVKKEHGRVQTVRFHERTCNSLPEWTSYGWIPPW
ncbi:electron carrier activity protein [Bacillus phage vB_BceS_LY5]|uniref:electron carrier activity protein n=1 Tax=Bacillus phage vB_BceS_LY5 TaxID=2996058 RepID=UPI004054DB5F|nr:electron carrier activity protein [Bacillus phage vB_BceS_LY5]